MEENDSQKNLQIVTRKLVSLTAGCIFILLIIFFIINRGGLEQTYLVVYVFLAGLIGGFVSIQQRLPEIRASELRELSNSWLSILLIPINGGIFAVILMLIFLSGILQGAMFPEYTHTEEFDNTDLTTLVTSFTNWTKTTFPTTGEDVAMLIFWSFVAGFSERFVPQIIRKTTDKADNS